MTPNELSILLESVANFSFTKNNVSYTCECPSYSPYWEVKIQPLNRFIGSTSIRVAFKIRYFNSIELLVSFLKQDIKERAGQYERNT